jgi:hypothetical protein
MASAAVKFRIGIRQRQELHEQNRFNTTAAQQLAFNESIT